MSTPCSPSSPTQAVVTRDAFLTLRYRLFVPEEGEGDAKARDLINTFEGGPATLSLGDGQLSPQLEERLLGLTQGSHETFVIDAQTPAFGPRNPTLLQWMGMPLLAQLRADDKAPPAYAVGDVVQFEGRYAGCVQAVRPVQEGFEGAVLFDFNHPLAGQAIGFEVQILGIL